MINKFFEKNGFYAIEQEYLSVVDEIVRDYSVVADDIAGMLGTYGDVTKLDPAIVSQLQTLTFQGFEDLGENFLDAVSKEIYENPKHPYTKALLDAAPVPDPEIECRRVKTILEGDIPSPLDPPPGCVFSTRCSLVTDDCRTKVPLLTEHSASHSVACINVRVAS